MSFLQRPCVSIPTQIETRRTNCNKTLGKSGGECSNAAARVLGIVRDFSWIEIFGRPRVSSAENTTLWHEKYEPTGSSQKLAENVAKSGTVQRSEGSLCNVSGFCRAKSRSTNSSDHAELKQILVQGISRPNDTTWQKSVNILRAICLVWGLTQRERAYERAVLQVGWTSKQIVQRLAQLRLPLRQQLLALRAANS